MTKYGVLTDTLFSPATKRTAQIFNFLVTTGSGFLDNLTKFLFVSQEVLGNAKLLRMQVGLALHLVR